MSYLIARKLIQVMREVERIPHEKSINNLNRNLEKLHYTASHQSCLINNWHLN